MKNNGTQEVGKVYETYDYELFVKVKGNRAINQAHVNRLAKKITLNVLVESVASAEFLMKHLLNHSVNFLIKLNIGNRFVITFYRRYFASACWAVVGNDDECGFVIGGMYFHSIRFFCKRKHTN